MLPDIQLTDVALKLLPATGRVPFEPLVQSMRLDISAAAFGAIVRSGVAGSASKLPVEVEITGTSLFEGGVEIHARVKRSLLRADLRARALITSAGPSKIRIRIEKVDAPAWVPVDMALGRAFQMAAAQPGVTQVGTEHAIDIDPAEVMASRNIPARLGQPGTWSVFPTEESIGVAYAMDSI